MESYKDNVSSSNETMIVNKHEVKKFSFLQTKSGITRRFIILKR